MVGKWELPLVSLTLGFLGVAPALAQPKSVQLLDKAQWAFSADGGKTFTRKMLEVKPGATVKVFARATFQLDDPAKVGGAWLIPGAVLQKPRFTLNGKPVTGLLPGMFYRMFPLDSQKYLAKGRNVLLAVGTVSNKGKDPLAVRPAVRLEMYPPQLVGVQTGPAIGAVTEDHFSVTCRTNLPAQVIVSAKAVEPAGGAESAAESKRGYYHRVLVKLPGGTRKFSYTVTCRIGDFRKTEGPFTARRPDFAGEKLRFVAAGDSRSYPKRWAAVAAAIQKAEPDLLVFSGDMVTDGRWDYQWDHEFFHPARALLATVPFYAVIGNHENNAPAYFELFHTPGADGRRKNWAQAIGPTLFIGIDGRESWSANSKNLKWLREVLKGSKEKFIFLASHYPAWSSGPHGRGGGRPMVEGQRFIMPLLARHKATAMIAGHDHNYERNEPPADKGVTAITTGGAGAPTYRKSGRASRGNPHSKIFAAKLHYCVFDIAGNVCEMKVYEPNGNLIDRKTFKARTVPKAPPVEKAKRAA